MSRQCDKFNLENIRVQFSNEKVSQISIRKRFIDQSMSLRPRCEQNFDLEEEEQSLSVRGDSFILFASRRGINNRTFTDEGEDHFSFLTHRQTRRDETRRDGGYRLEHHNFEPIRLD